jgi:hypothetical protein
MTMAYTSRTSSTKRIPRRWANGEKISAIDKEKMRALRDAGCDCRLPLFKYTQGESMCCQFCHVRVIHA